MREHGFSVKEVICGTGMSPASLYLWNKRLHEDGPPGL